MENNFFECFFNQSEILDFTIPLKTKLYNDLQKFDEEYILNYLIENLDNFDKQKRFDSLFLLFSLCFQGIIFFNL